MDGRIAPTRQFFALPVLGQVRAGLPQPEDQSAGLESVGVEDYLIRHPERTVFCRVRGDSMKDAGMLDGDMLVVERNRPTKPGDIVVAVVDNELTVSTCTRSRAPRAGCSSPPTPTTPTSSRTSRSRCWGWWSGCSGATTDPLPRRRRCDMSLKAWIRKLTGKGRAQPRHLGP